jgi:hypothetical protein
MDDRGPWHTAANNLFVGINIYADGFGESSAKKK